MIIGEIFTAPAERLIAGGRALCRVRGQAVFADAVPGDTIIGRIREAHRDWAVAETLEIAEASADRVSPECPVFGLCGGCAWQNVAYSAQIREKLGILGSALTRIGGFRAFPEPIVRVSGPYEYRNRVQFHRTAEAPGLGFRARRSAEIIPVKDCPIADPGIRQALRENRLIPPPHKDRFCVYAWKDFFQTEGFIQTKISSKENDFFKEENFSKTEDFFKKNDFSKEEKISKSENFSKEENFSKSEVFLEGKKKLEKEEKEAKEVKEAKNLKIRDREFLFDVSVFFQSNGFLLERVIEDLLEGAESAEGPCADIYCGVGTFGAFLGDRFSRLDLVEENITALALARGNVRGPAVRHWAVSADRWAGLQPDPMPYGFIVVDPPRAGLSAGIRSRLAVSGPPLLAYLSCDPASFARDAAALVKGGYSLEKLFLYDFYPQTPHIETLGFFKKFF
ncbi:MAG: methyltransferase [Spirochaetaceae bacterium]|nr:methyltransferase [Spirochaetaceae bacterium]